MLIACFVVIRSEFLTPPTISYCAMWTSEQTMWWLWLRKCQIRFDKETLTDLQRFGIILVSLFAQAWSSLNMLEILIQFYAVLL